MNNHRWLKWFLMIALPMGLLACGVSWLGYVQELRSDQTLLKNQELSKIKLQEEIAYHYFFLALNDLRQLANHVQWHEFFEPAGVRSKDILIKEFASVLGQTGMYYKIRVLNARGREVIKVETAQVAAPHTARGAMQDQSARDYFLASMALPPGEAYVSGFDVSSPTGMAEYPLTPVIRFGTPVLDRSNRKQGCVVINFFGAHLIRTMAEAFPSTSSQMLLVDARGYWIRALEPELEWGWLRKTAPAPMFQQWDSAAWQHLTRTVRGQIQTPQGLFTFTRIYPRDASTRKGRTKDIASPGERPEEPYWTLISFMPKETILAQVRARVTQALVLAGGLLLFVLLISWTAARAVERRRQAEEALLEHEKKYRYMFESNLVGVLYFDVQGKMVEGNAYVLRLSGLEAADLRTGNLLVADRFIPAAVSDSEWLSTIVAQGRMDSVEMNLVREDGTLVPVSCMGALLPGNTQCILLVIDLTERRSVEELRRRFFSTLSHELKNPITTIISYFRLLEKSHTFSETEKEFVEVVNRSANRLKLLADAILEVEHLEFSAPPENLPPVDCADVVRRTVEVSRIMAREKGVEVLGIVEGGGAFNLRAPLEHVEELVTNLIDNALKYTLAGRVVVRLSRVSGEREEIELRVEDTGIGIPTEHLAKIFEGFYRISSELQKKVPGSGLGLRIVKDIVERYGGTIRAESTLGEGSCFCVRFPAVND